VVVPNSATALRRIKRTDVLPSGFIKKSAFLPRKNGHDADGLSGSIARRELIRFHRAKYESEKTCAAFLAVAAIRSTVVDAIRLWVAWAPEMDDPAHALLQGVPGAADPSADQRRIAERFAELLGQAARSHVFPEK
jgi:hypothetical protein